jgi:CelD/BcsL family acetyltransferase involved in cellulose biosynthesis
MPSTWCLEKPHGGHTLTNGNHRAMPTALTVQTLSEPSAFAALGPEWTGLLEASDSDGFFLTWEWLFTWWKHLAAGRQLFMLTVRSGEDLVGIAPFALRPAALDRVPPLSCIELLGSGTAGSDYLDVIVRRHSEPEVARALAEHLARGGQMLSLARVRSSSSSAQSLAVHLGSLGWSVSETKSEACPVVRRVGPNWSTYLQSLGAEHRYAFRRKLRRLTQRYQISLDAARSEEERREAMQLLIALHQARWRKRGESEAFSGGALIAFHDEISALALRRGWLRLFVLRLDGRPAAALYGFRYRDVFYFYQSGFDPAFSKESVGLVILGLSIERAFEEGVAEYDLLHGVEAYKFHWAQGARELSRIELYPPGTRGLLYRGTVGLTRTARRLARGLLWAQ